MSINLKIGNYQKILIDSYAEKIRGIFEGVRNKTISGSEMTGWIEWVNKDHESVISKLEQSRENLKSKLVTDIVIVGTGGSYIGCRGGLEFCRNMFENQHFNFVYVPYFSDRYLKDLLAYLKNRKFAIVVISKSGTTLESAIAFRLLRELLFRQHGLSYNEYILAATDKSKGILRSVVDKENIINFVIEDDIGGRYSTLTAVGMIPMVLGGVDVRKIIEGARSAYSEHFNGDISENSASLYAAYRHFMFENKKLVNECLISYDPHLKFTLEATKQLFAESEGKSGKGLMPIILDFTPDLHSVGQLLQDGNKTFFETTIMVVKEKGESLKIQKSSFYNDDNLDWLIGKSLNDINKCAFKGTLDAHSNAGKINNVVIELSDWDPKTFGYLYYWLSLVAMFSSYLFGVNPFDQPGVETYKKRMFELLGKK